MPVKGKYLRKVKAASLNGVHLVVIIGSQEGALRVTIVLTIIQGSSRAEVQSAERLVILPHSVLVQSSPKPWEESTWSYEDEEWYSPQLESDEYEASKGKKGKGQGSKPKGKSKAKNAPRSTTPKPSQSSPSKGNRSQPNPKPEARSGMTNDFLFAMMSTKSKPTWRHSTWNGTEYMICTVVEPQKKLPVLREGKWSLVTDRRVSL